MTLIADVGPSDPGTSTWANAIRDQTVQVCLSSGRPTSPTEGMVIYETDTDRVMVYSGSAWRRIGAGSVTGRTGIYRYKNANQTISTFGSGGVNYLTWNVTAYDTDSFASSFGATIPSGLDGLYICSAGALWDGTGPGTADARLLIVLNASTSPVAIAGTNYSNAAFSWAHVSRPFWLSAGTEVSVGISQNSGSNKTIGASAGDGADPIGPFLEIIRIGSA